MRILLLSFYFEPDLCAGSFRATALARALAARLGAGGGVQVLTTQPNRYRSYSRSADPVQSQPGLDIRRFALPSHRSGFVDQSRAFASYARQVLRHVRIAHYDCVVATSSRLMTAFLAALVARRKNLPLYLDLRDIFVDIVEDILPAAQAIFLLPWFRLIERYTVHTATRINLVSEGFRPYFDEHYPGKSYSYVPNGIDEEFYGVDFDRRQQGGQRLIVLYPGNLGEGQGLHRIVPGLAAAMQHTHEFWIVGDGGARAKLASATQGLDNVKLMPPVGRAELLEIYRACDILFLHLNDYPACRRVLPSKLFEFAAVGKPVLAGVSGHAAAFLQRLPGVALFPPCDVPAAVAALRGLGAGSIDRTEFVTAYRRARLMQELSADILSHCAPK
ncbi:MAG: glycosyltransferase family 4 protein [Rhodocyclaceae bacterium]|nr:glycosyltransferase family 4 protein [Rhodocyclaceae bacterium]